MQQETLAKWIPDLIATDSISKFYEDKLWRRLRREVLRADKYECCICKTKGKYTKATVVHHVNYLKLHPELALEAYYKDDDGNIKRNLISLCHADHEHIHEWLVKEKEELLTKERW